MMQIEIDFESDEALYIQLRNQIIYGIATRQYQEGDSLPSVRQLAEAIGINMHTVNKAYAVLRQEGLIRLDRRTGAVIALILAIAVCAWSSTAQKVEALEAELQELKKQIHSEHSESEDI